QVDLVGAAARTDDRGEPDPRLPRRPAYATGRVELPIPPLSRKLTLDVKPAADKLEPGGTTDLALVLKDAHGEPVSGGEIAVVVVDESVLSLADDYRLPDPLDVFYPGRDGSSDDRHLRQFLMLANPLAM